MEAYDPSSGTEEAISLHTQSASARGRMNCRVVKLAGMQLADACLESQVHGSNC